VNLTAMLWNRLSLGMHFEDSYNVQMLPMLPLQSFDEYRPKLPDACWRDMLYTPDQHGKLQLARHGLLWPSIRLIRQIPRR
jgi:hypothetical protein